MHKITDVYADTLLTKTFKHNKNKDSQEHYETDIVENFTLCSYHTRFILWAKHLYKYITDIMQIKDQL